MYVASNKQLEDKALLDKLNRLIAGLTPKELSTLKILIMLKQGKDKG